MSTRELTARESRALEDILAGSPSTVLGGLYRLVCAGRLRVVRDIDTELEAAAVSADAAADTTWTGGWRLVDEALAVDAWMGSITEVADWLATEYSDWPYLLDVIGMLGHGEYSAAAVWLARIGLTITPISEPEGEAA